MKMLHDDIAIGMECSKEGDISEQPLQKSLEADNPVAFTNNCDSLTNTISEELKSEYVRTELSEALVVETLGIESPEALGALSTESLRAQSPKALETEASVALRAELPEVLETESPETLATESPETLATESPETLETESPETLEAESPEKYRSSFEFQQIPVQITGAWKDFENPADNYTRGCKWSPDGSCILTCSNDNKLRLFNFPNELWEEDFSWGNVKEMSSVLQVSEGTTIYDFAWYPFMSSSDPLTCCFCSTSQGSPVHMWDAFTGELRCSYRPFNHVDEVTSPHCLAFDTDGQKIFCGFHKMIRIFEVNRPGRDFTARPTYVKKNGLQGIVSCFAFSPVNRNISAVGTYSKAVGIYSEPNGDLEHILLGHQGGVTHMCFSPDGTKIYSGGRKDLEILCWDLRNLSSALYSLRRLCLTSQRLYFDISSCGQYVVSGNHNGIVTIWDVTKDSKEISQAENPIIEPVFYYQAHNDCVNGISLHPTMPVIATSSGQRKFPEPVDSDEDENGEMFSQKFIRRDNSLRLWWASNF